MKTEDEIRQEIEFQEQQYDKFCKLLAGDSLSEIKRVAYLSMMGKHAARRQALLWVIEA